MADLNIRLEVRLSPRLMMWGLASLLLSVLATELSSESVSLTTYYPAPSGIYNQMITTQNTYLARDAGGKVGIGTTTLGTTKLRVLGDDALDATLALQVTGSGGAGLTVTDAGNVSATGNITTTAGTISASGAASQLQISGTGNNFINGKTAFGVTSMTSGPGDVNAGGTGDFVAWKGSAGANSCTLGNLVSYAQGTTPCGGGTYATLTVGFITKYTSMGPAPIWSAGDPGKTLGQFFCCPCPAGSCPLL